jgi:hypothetical protein
MADLATGALLRPADIVAQDEQDESLPDDPWAGWPTRPLLAVQLTLGSANEPTDPARPEGVALEGPPVVLGAPRHRAVRRLLRRLATTSGPLLGTLGPSVSYADLEGTRPSVAVVAPEARPRYGAGPSGSWCQFLLGGRRHTLPCAPQAIPRKGDGRTPELLVVGLGRPRRGQVGKVVLGTIPLSA